MDRYKEIFVISICMFLWNIKDSNFSQKQNVMFPPRASETFRCEYIMETNTKSYLSDTAFTLPAQMRVQWTIITNGHLYMVIGKLESITIADQIVAESEDPDTLLIDNQINICFSFKNKIAAALDTFHIESDILKTENNRRYARMDARDSVSVYMDTTYQRFLTPFPQIKGNRCGIIKVTSPFQVCYLKSITKQDFDFAPFISRSGNFRKSAERVPLPFL